MAATTASQISTSSVVHRTVSVRIARYSYNAWMSSDRGGLGHRGITPAKRRSMKTGNLFPATLPSGVPLLWQSAEPQCPRRMDGGSHPHSPASAAPMMCRSSANAPQRAGASQRKGGDERGGVRHASSVRDPVLWQPRSRTFRAGATSVPRPHAAAFVAGNDAPLIDERAARRGRIATKGGDEHAGVKSPLSVPAPASRTGSNGGNLLTGGGHRPPRQVGQNPPPAPARKPHCPQGLDEHFASAVDGLRRPQLRGVSCVLGSRQAQTRFFGGRIIPSSGWLAPTWTLDAWTHVVKPN
jgi:hypothetical protein